MVELCQHHGSGVYQLEHAETEQIERDDISDNDIYCDKDEYDSEGCRIKKQNVRHEHKIY